MNYLPYFKFSASEHMSASQLMSRSLAQVWEPDLLLEGELLWFSLTMLPETWCTHDDAAEAPDETNLGWTRGEGASERREDDAESHRLGFCFLSCSNCFFF